MTTHNGHSRSISFRFSCNFLDTLHSSTITVSSKLCHLQFCRNHQFSSPDNKMARTRRSHQLGVTYCYAYQSTISMHAKQGNPKLINTLALSPEYSFRQNFIFRIFFSSFSMKTNDVSLPVAEPLLKIAQRVSLKPEAIRETKAGESNHGEPEHLLQANRRQIKSQ